LSTNKYLCDNFLAQFLPSLNAIHLRELHLSSVGLRSSSSKVIVAYLSSSRCRLHVLKCNDNSLGFRGIKPILSAIHNSNYTLKSVELQDNQLQGKETSPEAFSDEEGLGSQSVPFTRNDVHTWRSYVTLLKKDLLRNSHLEREVHKQAVILLHYARSLLLVSRCRQESVDRKILPQPNQNNRMAACSSSQFKSLPLELQHHILSFFAPSLSSSQRVRVIDYATSAKTLPSLFPFLSTISHSSMHADGGNEMICIPDPPNNGHALRESIRSIKTNRNITLCSAHYCMGTSNSLLCRREKERIEFLETVGCNSFELDSGESTRSARELFTLLLV